MRYLYVVSLVQIIFFSLLIILKKEKKSNDFLLLSWLFILAIHFVRFLAVNPGYLTGISSGFFFLHGPVLYTYFLVFANRKVSGKYVIIHYIPFVLYMFFLSFVTFKPSLYLLYFFVDLLKFGSLFGYSFYLIKFVERQKIRNFPNIFQEDFFWLKTLAYALLSLGLITFTSTLLIDLGIFQISYCNNYYIPIAFSIVTFFVSFIGIRQITIFSSITITGNSDGSISLNNPRNNSRDKYSKSGLTNEQTLEIYNILENFVKSEKVYKDPKLTLKKLSELINISTNQLSQVINQNAGKNFYDYINSYRVNHVINAIRNEEHKSKTLLSLAFEAGFNSKPSFNRAFKKQTRQTPSMFVKSSKNGYHLLG